MATVLGLSFGYHDAAAALMVDGKLLCAMQEERFTRIKNDPSYPRHAIEACLAHAGITAADLDRVIFYEDPFLKTERVLLNAIRFFPKAWKQFPKAIASQFADKIWVLDQISGRLDIDRKKISCMPHHLSHAASSFYFSPFNDAAILTVDGVGEHATTCLWKGQGADITLLHSVNYPHSIGLLYAALTAFLGFKVNSGEYKVMGLAAFGKPVFKDEFRRLATFHDDGSYQLDLRYFAHHTDTEMGFSPFLETLLGPRRCPTTPWDMQNPSDQKYADIAASLQWLTEELMLHLAKAARRLTGSDNLCLAGGVALNCVANTRLLHEAGFKDVFVQPAAGDAGGALGAAVWGSIQSGDPRPAPMRSCALGTTPNADRALALCKNLGLTHSLPDDIYAQTAALLSRQQVVAFVQDRFEWGPRALGMRSILAHPQRPQIRDKLNVMVKEREIFRPFAPAVLAGDAGLWFEDSSSQMAPFMTSVSPVKPARAAEVEACVHVDGTSRVQAVTPESSPGLCRVLEHVKAAGQPPVLLNTSLNINNEPMIASEIEAITFFLSRPIEAMVIGPILIQR